MRETDTTDASGHTPPRAGAVSPRRRQFLKGLAIPPAATALAGCSSIGSDGDDPIVENLEPGDSTGFPGAVRFGDRYAMEVTREADGAQTLTGRFHGENRVLQFDGADGDAVQSYVVDGDGYVVTAGQCIAYPDAAVGLESVAAVDAGAASDTGADPELTVIDRTTIEGRDVLVLEPASGGETGVRYYVDDETRYLRRIETGTTTVDYHSWNEVEPIEPPDADCRPIG